MDPKTYRLPSSAAVHSPGLIESMKVMARNDRQQAFFIVASTYLELPALLIYDLIDGYIITTEVDGVLEFTWGEPLAPLEEYRYNWRPFTFVVGEPKLLWLESVLDTLNISHRRMPQDRPFPRLEIPAELFDKANEIWEYTIGGRCVKHMPSDDDVFQPGGDAWSEDNIVDDQRPISETKDE